MASPRFSVISNRARLATVKAFNSGLSRSPRNTASACAWVRSAALIGESDTCAAARDGASLRPSPTMATRHPWALQSSMRAILSAGMSPACQLSIPSAFATGATDSARSPERMRKSSPRSRSDRTTSTASGRNRCAEAYINFMEQCVFLGDRENQCAEEWRSMDTQERFFYSEAGRRAQAKFQRKKREEDERAMAECEALGRNDALCKIEQFLKAKKKIE